MHASHRLFATPAAILALTVLFVPAAWAIDGCKVVDLDGDGSVNEVDLALIEADLGLPSARNDLDGSGLVDDADVAILWSYRKSCPFYCLSDLDGDNVVGEYDRMYLEAYYGFQCLGDLNRDGQICPRDSEVMVAYLGSPTPLSQSAARADLNGDGVVDIDDALLLEALHGLDCSADLNRDTKVDSNDLGYLFSSWGPCPGTGVSFLRLKGDPKNTCDTGGT